MLSGMATLEEQQEATPQSAADSARRWLAQGWVRPLGLVLLLTLVYLGLAFTTRSSEAANPLEVVTSLEFDPYNSGQAVQELIVPILLLYLLINSRFFQQLALRDGEERPLSRLGMVLALIQIAVYFFLFVLTPEGASDNLTLGIFVPVVAGLLGGWRSGLALGLLTTFMVGMEDLIVETFPWALENNSSWWEYFQWGFLFNLSALAPLWAGFSAGYLRQTFGRRLLNPGITFGLGALLIVIPHLLFVVAWQDVYFVARMLPTALVVGFGLTAFSLMVRNAETTVIRQAAEAAQLNLARAEVQALRAQINPHFLFNSLNTIRYFVRTEPETARQLLLNLSEVFQNALKAEDFVQLREEIAFTKSYLALEQARLDERLSVSWFVQSENLLDAQVPTLLLEPLVENAVIHGIAPRPDGGRIQISITQGNGRLNLQVIDDGMGMPAEQVAAVSNGDPGREGSIGLRNINGRLQALYGSHAKFAISATEGQGTTVRVEIPISNEE